METTARKFALALRLNREQQGLSQEELAKMLGMKKQTVSKYELGQREPKISTASKFAQMLGLKLSDMTGE